MTTSRVTTSIDLQQFKGIFNTSDDVKDLVYLKEADNVYITKERDIKSRKGIEVLNNSVQFIQAYKYNNYLIVTYESNGFNIGALDLSSNSIIHLDTLPHRIKPTLWFCVFNDLLIVSDESYFKVFTPSLTTLQYQNTDPFKKPMIGGKYPCIFQGRLFVSKGNFLYFSDALSILTRDIRYNFIVLQTRITGIVALSNILYIASDKQYGLIGDSLDNSKLIVVSDNPMFENTWNIVNSNKLANFYKIPSLSGEAVIWLSKDGVVLGFNDGNTFKLTHERYKPVRTNFKGNVVLETQDEYKYIVI